MAIVSNSAPSSIAAIQTQFERFGCPMPSITGLWSQPESNGQGVNATNLQYSGATYNYPNVGNQTLTLTCTEVHTLDSFDYAYGSPTVAFAGTIFFISDWLSELIVNKLAAFFTILFYILTPANLNFLGFTIADLTGVALMAIIGLYILCYIAIGALLYKIISPFAGAS